MNRFKQLVCLLTIWMVSLPTFMACSDDSNDEPTVDITIPEIYKTLKFSKSGGEQTVNIQSTVDLNFSSSDETWLTVEKEASSSQKIRKCKITCKANGTSSERTGTITVSASGFSGTISVTQAQAIGDELALLSQDMKQIASGSDGDEYDVTVSANGLPTFSASAFWITSEDAERNADGIYTFSVTVAKNYTAKEREGVITISNGAASFIINVSQVAGSSNISGMDSDAETLAAKIFACVNIGNTLEATGGEISWGNPKVSEAYISGLREMGFNAVRIPCAWHSHLSDATNYTIDPTWMARVTEVVDYCIKYDIIAILNCHWDGGWLEDNIFSASKEEAITAEQNAIWTQIATNFKDYDEHLLFASCNEPGMNETSSGGKSWTDATAVARLVKYEQTFINAVRATGDNNAVRCLVVQGLGTNIDNTISYMPSLPTDEVENRLMVEVHYYDPYQFCLMEEDASWGKVYWYWGEPNHKTGSSHNPTFGEESYVKDQFAKMKSRYVDKGYPVIIGEYGARIQTASGRSDKTEEFDAELHNKSRAYFNEVVTREAKNHGCVPCYWETGNDINRNDGSVKLEYAIDGIMEGASDGKYPY